MDISTGSWFKYLREEVLTEGLRDIGLPEYVVDFIEEAMPSSPEKSKVYAGNGWKKAFTTDNVQNLQFTAVNHLIDQYGDYVQKQPSSADPIAPLQARTAASYRTGEDTDYKRVEYDDEQKKRAEQVKFVIQNIKNVLAKPMGTWTKAFKKAVKALSKVGIPSEKVESTQEYLKLLLQQEFQNWWYRYDLLFAWLNSEPTNYELIKGEEGLARAYHVAQDDLNNREDPEMVIHQFDDGSYWYNLDVSNCAVEGERMGHCGGDNRGVLVSLRKKKGKRKASSSYVTMTWSDEDLYQIKGRSNDAPPNEMWDHIDWFIKNMGITAVHETGEHSNDYDGFREMNDYLSTQNRDVSFEGAVDIEAIDEALSEIANNYDGEQTSISAEAQGPEEHGGDGIYINMNGHASIEIELRWKGFRDKDGFYIPTLGPDDNTPDDSLSPIPINSWGSDSREFEDESGFDTIGWDLPGDDPEAEWSIEMKEGSHPPDYEGDFGAEGPMLAVLRVEWRASHQESADNVDEATRVFENFASEMQNFDESYDEKYAEVRGNMAQHGYIAKTTYDRDREEMAAYDMDHWKVWSEKSGLEFWFRPHRQSDSLVNSGGDTARLPMDIMMWEHDEVRAGHIDALWVKIFGTSILRGKIQSNDLNRNMARNLEKFYAEQEASDPAQETLPFGQEYSAPPARAVLAKDSRFIIEPTTKYHGEGSDSYPNMSINWRYTIGVDHTASTEEVQTVKDIVKYFNENPDMVQHAAMETIRDAMAGTAATAKATKADVLSGTKPGEAIRAIDDRHGPRAMAGDDINAEQMILTAKWIKDNFDQMSEPEKYVAWFHFLKPMKENYYRPHLNPIYIGDESDEGAVGQPVKWVELVQKQMKKMKTFSGTVRKYSGVPHGETQTGTLGEPQPAGGPVVRNARGERIAESVEDQIMRIDKILQEKDPNYDLRIYGITIDVALSKDVGGEVQETQTEIRGINGVTTVRTVGDMTQKGQALSGQFEIKFEILGAMSRVKYRDKILVPGMMQIRGLRILRVSPMHRTNRRGTIRTVREVLVNEMGGLAGNLGALRKQRPQTTMTTPRKMLDDIATDWRDGGVMAYDAPMDSTDMRYHVMMPVEELLPYISREFRAPKDAYDGMYQQFIKNGARAPVFVAVGKNGRIKVTGNEDLIWFAKRSGLQELPVFLSYQSQV